MLGPFFQIKLYNIATFDKPLGYQAALHLEKVDLLRLIDCTNYTSKNTTANYTPNSNFYLQYLRAMAIYRSHQHIDLVNKRADPLTPRRTSSLESTYVPQTSLDKSNISGGTCTRSSWTMLLGVTSFWLRLSPRLIVTSMSAETSLATGRLDGNSLCGTSFLHFLADNFWAKESWLFGCPKDSFSDVFSSLRYNRLPDVNRNKEFTSNFPVIPLLSWGQSRPFMTVKPMSDVKEILVFSFDALFIVRYTSPIRTRAEGWRRVNPICLPVQYNRRHFPGSNSNQFCTLK